MRMRSRPEMGRSNTEKIGAVRRMIQAINVRSSTRMTIAASRPARRALGWSVFGSLPERIEMKTTLSMPRTISRKVNVASAMRPSAVQKASMPHRNTHDQRFCGRFDRVTTFSSYAGHLPRKRRPRSHLNFERFAPPAPSSWQVGPAHSLLINVLHTPHGAIGRGRCLRGRTVTPGLHHPVDFKLLSKCARSCDALTRRAS